MIWISIRIIICTSLNDLGCHRNILEGSFFGKIRVFNRAFDRRYNSRYLALLRHGADSVGRETDDFLRIGTYVMVVYTFSNDIPVGGSARL
jgi:hypothetical protein